MRLNNTRMIVVSLLLLVAISFGDPRLYNYQTVQLAWRVTLTPASANLLVWSAVEGLPTNSALLAVAMVSEAEVWVVGRVGAKGRAYRLHLVQSHWQVARQDVFDAPIQAVSALSTNDVWAAGASGRMMHWDGRHWQDVAQPLANVNFLAIQMLNSNEGWASGDAGPRSDAIPNPTKKTIMLHYKDGQWQHDRTFYGKGAGTLSFVGDEGWAGSVREYEHLWHYHAGKWAQAQECVLETRCEGRVVAIHTFGPDDTWALTLGATRRRLLISHYQDGVWFNVYLPKNVPLPKINLCYCYDYASCYYPTGYSMVFSDPQHGFASGWGLPLLAFKDGQWSVVEGLDSLLAISMADKDHAIGVSYGRLVSYGYGQQLRPDQPAASLRDVGTVDLSGAGEAGPGGWYYWTAGLPFPQTGHAVISGFRKHWTDAGGKARFGVPLTEAMDENEYITQYFERTGFAYYSRCKDKDRQCLTLLPLGKEIATAHETEGPFKPAPAKMGLCCYFASTQHNLAAEFIAVWQDDGLNGYGAPVSEPFFEQRIGGNTVLVQYFEKAKLEYHPELPAAEQVELGALGHEVLQQRGWLP